MTKKKFHYWLLQILIIAAIIYLCTKISFLFKPVAVLFSTLFVPIIITGFLYFLLNPIVKFLQKNKIPKTLAIIILYVGVIGIIILAIGSIVPMISKQVSELFSNIPKYADDAVKYFQYLNDTKQYKWIMNQEYVKIEDITENLKAYAQTIPSNITNGIGSIISTMTNITITIVTVPFLLFYCFKDGSKFPEALSKFFPSSYRKEGLKIIKDTSETIAAYIQGQVIVALFVGTLSLIGYWIIGLDYALVMALVVAVTNIIPYVGPLIGGAPAVIIALFTSPTQALLVIIVITIAQQIEGNILSPLILGKRLDTHPATIIILLLVAGNLAGILGMILAVPTYAAIKTIVININRLLKARKAAILNTQIPPINDSKI
ncbi:AI-2E family transporter [Cytobacillus oceanisediminis]|uniref:AI-2E family transporter n=1 Tax=Niallia alba TaxID=2729105 RepID=A0A7Y0KAN3_9BACI|nr:MULTISPECIES: AI-2E family transporter [Bacillaceae]EOR25453.1 membrane protein YueF [Niallia nealsonii AAU1]MBQ6448136.1 AI-2E family transporter [Bacillus sp. (in: firmicutes)]MDU1844232.1 AI-2E family transporter [Niallia nealsonii]MBZ9533320.1 AI-2E family transporter [Cytobacillus oceanisediminis]NMO78746.1 AI-2E family transporter [Niallia alba]